MFITYKLPYSKTNGHYLKNINCTIYHHTTQYILVANLHRKKFRSIRSNDRNLNTKNKFYIGNLCFISLIYFSIYVYVYFVV